MWTMFQAWDAQTLLWIQETARLEVLNPLMMAFTRLGDGGMLFLCVSLLLLWPKTTRKAAVAALLAVALGAVCTNLILKPLVERARPYEVLEGLRPLLVHGTDPHSFPSGHTCAAFAACLAWRRFLPWRRAGRFALTAAVLMGLSRLYVGVHYPFDVLAGAVVGSLCAVVVCRLLERNWNKIP